MNVFAYTMMNAKEKIDQVEGTLLETKYNKRIVDLFDNQRTAGMIFEILAHHERTYANETVLFAVTLDFANELL